MGELLQPSLIAPRASPELSVRGGTFLRCGKTSEDKGNAFSLAERSSKARSPSIPLNPSSRSSLKSLIAMSGCPSACYWLPHIDNFYSPRSASRHQNTALTRKVFHLDEASGARRALLVSYGPYAVFRQIGNAGPTIIPGATREIVKNLRLRNMDRLRARKMCVPRQCARTECQA